MKMTNQPPAPMSAWKPRRPSAALKQRIFTARPATPEHKSFWNLLAPATACMALSLLALNSGNGLTLVHHPLGGQLLNNLNYSAFASGSAQTPQNHMDSLTFEWTNRSVLSSPIGFTSLTN